MQRPNGHSRDCDPIGSGRVRFGDLCRRADSEDDGACHGVTVTRGHPIAEDVAALFQIVGQSKAERFAIGRNGVRRRYSFPAGVEHSHRHRLDRFIEPQPSLLRRRGEACTVFRARLQQDRVRPDRGSDENTQG